MNKDLELAKTILQADGLSFVIVRDGQVLARSEQAGVGALLAATETLGEAARGATLADTIVGQAVAMVARHTGIVAVYARLASEAAQAELARGGIPLEAQQIVPAILNKSRTGMCPMERLTLPFKEPALAVAALQQFVMRQQTAANSRQE